MSKKKKKKGVRKCAKGSWEMQRYRGGGCGGKEFSTKERSWAVITAKPQPPSNDILHPNHISHVATKATLHLEQRGACTDSHATEGADPSLN